MLPRIPRIARLATSLAFLAIAPAGAQTVTFDNLAGLNGQGFTSYSEAGYDVDLYDGYICEAHLFGNPVPDLFGGPVCNSSITYTTLRVRRSGGGLFNFIGAELATQNGDGSYIFDGVLASLNVYSAGGTIPSGAGFNNYASFNAATDIDALLIGLSTRGTSYNIDNIQLRSVVATPEPASMLLLGTGLVGVFAVARRKREG